MNVHTKFEVRSFRPTSSWDTMVRHDGKELKWPPAGTRTGDILVRWLAYADDICILAESKTELAATLNVFNDVLTEYGMMLSAEKSFWMTLGCSGGFR